MSQRSPRPHRIGKVRATWDELRMNLPVITRFVILLIATGALLIYLTGGTIRIGGGERTEEEKARILASGDCAVRPSGVPVGRVVAVVTPTSGVPKQRYQIEVLEERRFMMLYADEVRVVPCSTISLR
jgi:hypothetical protein